MPVYGQFVKKTGDAMTGILDVQASARFRGGPWVDVMSGGLARKCSADTTNLATGTISGGSNSLAVTGGSSFVNGHGVWVLLDSLAIFRSYIVSGGGTATWTLNDNAPSAATAAFVGHDDTLAIQDAIDFAGANGAVYIPPGTYYIWQLKALQAATIAGAGIGATTLQAIPGNTSTGMIILNAGGISQARLRDFVVNGNKSGGLTATCPGIYLNNTSTGIRRHMIQNVRITNCAGDGLKMAYSKNNQFSNLVIDLCDGHGIVDDGNSFFHQFTSIEISSAGLNGMHLTGDGHNVATLFVNGSGRIDAVSYGDNIHINANSHGHVFQGFWLAEGLRTNINIDAASGAGGQLVMVGNSHQNNAAEHLRITSGSANKIRLALVDGTVRAATSILNMVGGTRNDIEITYLSGSNVLAVNAPPAIGAALIGSDNYIVMRDGSKLSTGDVNIFECEPLITTPGFIEGASSIFWEYPGAIEYELT